MTDQTHTWKRSSFCESGACIEVRYDGGIILARDSTRPNLMIVAGEQNWADFIAGVKAGEFDLPELHG